MTQQEEHKLTPGELLDFLGIELQRLRVWVEAGLLGEEHRTTGRGNPRSFSRRDVIIARVIRELLDLTKPRSLAIAKEGLLSEMARVLPEVLKLEGAVISNSTGKPSLGFWLLLSWNRQRQDWHLTGVQSGDTNFPRREVYNEKARLHVSSERRPGEAVILIPLGEMIEEVDSFLERKGVSS